MGQAEVTWGACPALEKAGIAAGGQISAAADFLGNGAIEINRYDSEITDLVRRESPIITRFKRVPSSGQPDRWFEEAAIMAAGFVTITNGAALGTPTPSGPTRFERTAFIKALSGQTNISLFDADVTRQQGQFAYVEAKDIADIAAGIARTEAAGIWTGTDTSLITPTTNQYVGLLEQINQTAQIAIGASIIDGLKSQIAYMAGNSDYKVRPSVIVANPVLGDYIDREAKASSIKLGEVVVGGVSCQSVATQAGILPIVPDPFLPANTPSSSNQYGFTAPPTNYKNYFAAILTEDMIRMPYVHGGDGNPNPRIFQLGLVGGLLGQYVGVLFNAIVAKGLSAASMPAGAYTPNSTVYPHSIVAVTRP
jgi:hypothetical protein